MSNLRINRVHEFKSTLDQDRKRRIVLSVNHVLKTWHYAERIRSTDPRQNPGKSWRDPRYILAPTSLAIRTRTTFDSTRGARSGGQDLARARGAAQGRRQRVGVRASGTRYAEVRYPYHRQFEERSESHTSRFTQEAAANSGDWRARWRDVHRWGGIGTWATRNARTSQSCHVSHQIASASHHCALVLLSSDRGAEVSSHDLCQLFATTDPTKYGSDTLWTSSLERNHSIDVDSRTTDKTEDNRDVRQAAESVDNDTNRQYKLDRNNNPRVNRFPLIDSRLLANYTSSMKVWINWVSVIWTCISSDMDRVESVVRSSWKRVSTLSDSVLSPLNVHERLGISTVWKLLQQFIMSHRKDRVQHDSEIVTLSFARSYDGNSYQKRQLRNLTIRDCRRAVNSQKVHESKRKPPLFESNSDELIAWIWYI